MYNFLKWSDTLKILHQMQVCSDHFWALYIKGLMKPQTSWFAPVNLFLQAFVA